MERSSQLRNYQSCIKLPALIILVLLALLLLRPANLLAKPMSSGQAERVVNGWLKLDPNPLQTPLGNQVGQVDVFGDDNGEAIYYVIYLQPAGFVIVPADDLVEPIIAFADDGIFDPSDDNPLGALVSRDLPGRVAAARDFQAAAGGSQQKKDLTEQQVALEKACLKAQGKWAELQDYSDMVGTLGIGSISDVWVAPIVQSEWGQTWVCQPTWYCYNYYTPNNWPCGCVATATAQLMRFHEHPGTYVWSNLVLRPEENCGTITESQRQDIGQLCYDAAEAVDTVYGSGVSTAYLSDAKDALLTTFSYNNAVHRSNYPSNIPEAGLNGMINPNLDANHPVILGVYHTVYGNGHAILADGYGYDASTLYHHLNMGWDGYDDAWYNLPTIDTYYVGYHSDTVDSCIYNIFTSGSGEIISGRVTDDTSSDPISGVTVTAQGSGGPYTDETDDNGIYALAKVPSNTTFTVSASKENWSFSSSQVVTTGTSSGSSNNPGNRWGIDFVGTAVPVDCNIVTIGAGTSTWDYPMYTYYHDSRTQVIYLSSEIGGSGNITKLALYVATVPGQTMDNWTIRMKYTSMSSYSTASLDATGWTVVYQANEPPGTTGWRTFTFSTPFEYNGTDNLLVDFSHNNSSYTSEGECRYSTPGGTRTAYARSDSDHGDPLDWSGTSSPTVDGTTKVPNVQLTICAPSPGDFEPDGDVDFYDFAVFAPAWRSSLGDGNWKPACDISDPNDSVIDELDLAVFTENWLAGIE